MNEILISEESFNDFLKVLGVNEIHTDLVRSDGYYAVEIKDKYALRKSETFIKWGYQDYSQLEIDMIEISSSVVTAFKTLSSSYENLIYNIVRDYDTIKKSEPRKVILVIKKYPVSYDGRVLSSYAWVTINKGGVDGSV